MDPVVNVSSVSSPEYYSCEESDDFKDLFQPTNSFIPKLDELKIDYSLNDCLEYYHFDSNFSIVAFHGCLRIGKIIKLNHSIEPEIGLNKNLLIEIPIFILPKFLFELKNCLVFIFTKKPENEPDCEKELGEVYHKTFLICKKSSENNIREISFFIKNENRITFEIKFKNELLKVFTKNVFNLVLQATFPKPFQQEITISFLCKLDSKQEKLIESLYEYWKKQQKLKLLFDALSEVIKEKENKEILITLCFNFIKKNIILVHAMQKCYKFIYLQ
jgi:hypothetical protein